MFGKTEMADALNVSAIKAVVDTFTTGLGGYAIFADVVVPRALGVEKKSINFYRSASASRGHETEIYNYTINCRAQTQNEAEVIAETVIENINRVIDTDYNIVCTILPVIGPQNEIDNYNCPIEAVIKLR
jgi:hypothetical protein